MTTRLCLDRLRARTPVPVEGVEEVDPSDPGDDLALADTVGMALQVVLDRLAPRERIAFVLHDSFGIEFATIAAILDTNPVSARKLASRARTKLAATGVAEERSADWEVVDAFMAAAKAGDFQRLLLLLAPDSGVKADAAAILVGTPERLDGRERVATFFNGSAQAALAVFFGERPGVAWFDRGTARVLFDFTIVDGLVQRITFRADPETLSQVVRRKGSRLRSPRGPDDRQTHETDPPPQPMRGPTP